MNKKELLSWLKTNEAVDIHMPNEIFDELKQIKFQSWKHRAFSYAFLYLVTYLYRNVIYGSFNPELYNLESIMKVFVSNHRKLLYITKKNGLLEQHKLIETTTNYPISYYFQDGLLEFTLVKDLRSRMDNVKINHSPNLSIKKPVKAFVRFDDEEYTGTFYDFQNTHLINIETFIDIITEQDLNYIGFYIYAYLYMMHQKYPAGYNTMNNTLIDIIGGTSRTITKYTKLLEEKGFIVSQKNMVAPNVCKGKKYQII
jgi:hypothetical protein